MSKVQAIWNTLFGNTDSISTERYFVTITAFTAAIISLLLCILHIVNGITTNAIIFSAVDTVLIFTLYYFVRFRGSLLIPKIIMTLGCLMFLDLTWYSKFMSNGPLLLVILIFAAVIVMIWEGKRMFLFLGLYFINAFTLFYVELNTPKEQLHYPEEATRSVDIYLSFFIYAILYVFLLYVYKREFLRQKEKAIKSDKLKSAFLANMSHEIRTPMNGILGFSDLLKNPNLTDKAQLQYIELIEKSGNRMLNVINDIIDVSKIEAGLVTIDRNDLNLKEQLAFILDFFKPEVAAKGLKIKCNNIQFAEQISLITDRKKFLSIFINLVKNAIKYTDEGSIELGFELHKEELHFFVKDTGIGIIKNRQDAIFERFIQADIDDVQARQGSGLGLSIAKSYVELLGGKIWLESELGKGSIFRFKLPHGKELENEKLIGNTISLGTNSSENVDLKILIVEDDEISENLLSIQVSDFDMVPLKVRTGAEAVEVCRNNSEIDIILMDIQLPLMNGYEATRQIRKFNKDVIIIAQTAYGFSEDRKKAISAGCNDYISKPIQKIELVALIKKYFT